ncbi:ac20 [Troides aeacus nucleopolyhedrovirus]|nr:ac20 [Troides aeacus nucleopolyhedrovirus]
MGGGVGGGVVGVLTDLMGDSSLDLRNSLGESVDVRRLMISSSGNGGSHIVHASGKVHKTFLGTLYTGLGTLYVLPK